jgi:hypothetical protein
MPFGRAQLPRVRKEGFVAAAVRFDDAPETACVAVAFVGREQVLAAQAELPASALALGHGRDKRCRSTFARSGLRRLLVVERDDEDAGEKRGCARQNAPIEADPGATSLSWGVTCPERRAIRMTPT